MMLFIWVHKGAVLTVLGGRSFGNDSYEGGQRYGGFN